MICTCLSRDYLRPRVAFHHWSQRSNSSATRTEPWGFFVAVAGGVFFLIDRKKKYPATARRSFHRSFEAAQHVRTL